MSTTVQTLGMLEGYYCDRCGAHAFYMTALHREGELFWCAHHYKQYATALEPVTEYTADESHRLHAGITDDKHVN
ncbi:hypothetical protein AB0N65_11755 [Paenarthrobacter sp. NPDC089322]|uniref:DUF7455 domain-containing protein n=1 Tax=Paenarthrobacter sp. NPDC089322 TaxID=3155065 RepID=UPI0034360681